MNNDQVLASFKRYSDRLTLAAKENPDVIGLVFLGSAAAMHRVDQWSDHDFYLVVKNGMGEFFRTNLSWVPDIEQAVLTPRETEHGLKIVFEDGRILEFAVFEDQELELASANDWIAAVDKQNIEERMRSIELRSSQQAPLEFATEYELFLAQLLIGVGRYRRGEVITAGQFVRSYAAKRLISLVKLTQAPVPGTESESDNLDATRRFEKQHPSLARKIESALATDVESAAKKLLSIACGLRPLSDAENKQVAAIRARLSWN